MNEYYYEVSYIEYKFWKVKNTGRVLIRSATELSKAQIKRLIRKQLNQPNAVIKLAEVNNLDKETFIALGNDPNEPYVDSSML